MKLRSDWKLLLNPPQTSQFRKSLSLRKTKTDKVDARTISTILAQNQMSLKYPSAKNIEKSRFDSFANLIESTSNGKFYRLKAKEIRSLARKSVGVFISAKAMELKHTINLIQLLDSDISEIELQIQDSLTTTIPCISFKRQR